MLRGAWTLLVFGIVTPVVATWALLGAMLAGRGEIGLRPARVWSRCLLAACGARVRYRDREHATRHSPCIFAANHASNLDIWAVFPALPDTTKFVAKHSLFKMPFVGAVMRRWGFISIDRTNRQRAIASLSLAAARVNEGASVIVFPEGTRSRDGGLQGFKKGPFHLALAAGVPLVPIAISGSFDVLRPGDWRVRPGDVEVRFLPPIDTRPYAPDGLVALMERTHAVIAGALQDRPSPADRADPRVAAR